MPRSAFLAATGEHLDIMLRVGRRYVSPPIVSIFWSLAASVERVVGVSFCGYNTAWGAPHLLLVGFASVFVTFFVLLLAPLVIMAPVENYFVCLALRCASCFTSSGLSVTISFTSSKFGCDFAELLQDLRRGNMLRRLRSLATICRSDWVCFILHLLLIGLSPPTSAPVDVI